MTGSRDKLQSLATKGRAAGQGRHLVELSERAQEILRKQGWFINGRIQRGEIADAVVTVVEKHDGPDKAASLDGLCTKTFGYSDESLRHLMARLVALRGPVQDRLNDDRNLVLCGTRVKEYLRSDGRVIERTAVGRFVTRDPDMIEQYLFDPRVKRHLSTADTTA